MVKMFAEFVESLAVLPDRIPSPWKGHAYLLNSTSARRVSDVGVVLAGDAAGLALAPSGEGILAAVESGLMAADAVIEARGDYSRERLSEYDARINARFGK